MAGCHPLSLFGWDAGLISWASYRAQGDLQVRGDLLGQLCGCTVKRGAQGKVKGGPCCPTFDGLERNRMTRPAVMNQGRDALQRV